MIAAQTQPADPSVTQGEIAKLREMMMGMPLQQLQAFAQQHMSGPNGGIIVGLASQIANAKKAAQAPQQQPQITVAQQDIQSIAPENQGIGQLPARNIEGMAAGGIVGYADGGHVGGRMENGERRFAAAGLTPNAVSVGAGQFPTGASDIYNMTPEEVRQAMSRRITSGYYTPPPPTPAAIAESPSFLSRLGSSLNGGMLGRMIGIGGAAALYSPDLNANEDEELAARQNAGSRPFLTPTGAGAGRGSQGIAALNPDINATSSSAAPSNVPAVDPKTKAPPKVADAKKEGTVASDHLYDLLDNKGTAYKGLTLADVNQSIKLAQEGAPSAADLYNQANTLAKEKDAAAKAEYKPLQDLSDAEHKRLQNRNDNAFANALIMGSLAGMNSRNIGEFYEKAGKVGGESYIHDKDYADAAERELLKSDLATKQALDARLNNNERDAQTYLQLSRTEKQNAIANTMAAYGLTDKSQYQAGELGIRGLMANLEGRKVNLAEALQPYQQRLMSAQAGWYGQRGAGLTGKLNAQQLAQVDKLATADMQKWRALPENMLKSDEEAQAYYQQRAEAHAATLGTSVPSSGTVGTTAAPASTSGFKLLGGG